MFMETIAALIILFPTLMAVATGVGIDPVHFATFAVLNLMIGLTTPPVGVCLFVCANIAKEPLWPVIKASLLIGNLIVLLMVSYIPQLSLWLPNLLFGSLARISITTASFPKGFEAVSLFGKTWHSGASFASTAFR